MPEVEEEEVWVQIEDFPYLVSDYGNIKHQSRLDTYRKAGINHRGFPTLVLFRTGEPTRYVRQVNKLVAEAFLDPHPDPAANAVWHIDGDLSNCRADNLKWEYRDRVLDWNEAHRRGTPKYRTPQGHEYQDRRGIRERLRVRYGGGRTRGLSHRSHRDPPILSRPNGLEVRLMPSLDRANHDAPCQPDGAHHPHLLVCGDPEDNCWDDLNDGRGYMPYHELTCCVCGGEWPCPTKARHLQDRRRAHHLAEALAKIEYDGEPYFHEEPHMYGRVCVKLKEPDRLNRRWGTVYWEDGQGYTLSSGCIGPHNV